jgi:glycerophosphoryl diester phosphodiesterase
VRTLVWSWEVADPALLAAAAARGLRVWVYGVEGEEERRRAVDLGLAGVITDRPDLLLAAQGGAMRR